MGQQPLPLIMSIQPKSDTHNLSKEVSTSWEGFTTKKIHWEVHRGNARDVLRTFPGSCIDCVVTSPPYFWLRDYGVNGQIGLEDSVDEYITSINEVMDEVYRILRPTGVLFLNLGDTYYSGKGESQGVDRKSKKRRFGLRAVDKSGGMGMGLRPKTAIGIPWRVAIEMCKRKWVLRSPIIWYRKHSLPEPVSDRPRRTYEHVFMLVKNRKYHFSREPLISAGEEDLWEIAARPESGNLNTAPFPDELVKRCLDIGCPAGGVVLDPFAGSGTTLRVALNSERPAKGIDLNPEFCEYIVNRLKRL